MFDLCKRIVQQLYLNHPYASLEVLTSLIQQYNYFYSLCVLEISLSILLPGYTSENKLQISCQFCLIIRLYFLIVYPNFTHFLLKFSRIVCLRYYFRISSTFHTFLRSLEYAGSRLKFFLISFKMNQSTTTTRTNTLRNFCYSSSLNRITRQPNSLRGTGKKQEIQQNNYNQKLLLLIHRSRKQRKIRKQRKMCRQIKREMRQPSSVNGKSFPTTTPASTGVRDYHAAPRSHCQAGTRRQETFLPAYHLPRHDGRHLTSRSFLGTEENCNKVNVSANL